MTVTVTGDLEKFVQEKIAAGEYRSALEVVADALMRLKQADDQGQAADATPKDEAPRLVDKNGILVVEAEVVGDLSDVVGTERERRMRDLMGQTGR